MHWTDILRLVVLFIATFALGAATTALTFLWNEMKQVEKEILERDAERDVKR